jgi:hypothetical protein
MTDKDPRIDPSKAADLDPVKEARKAQLAAEVQHQADIADARAFYKKLRRSFGQRDRMNVFLKAEVRRKEREGS